MKAILTATWAAVLFITSIPASAAQSAWDTRSVRVDYSDLDLTRAPGASTLEHRVTGAIHQVCDWPAFELREKIRQRACERGVGTAASKDIQNAIATARQRPSTRAGAALAGTADRTISGSRQTEGDKQHFISRR
jgi:UrcA family protein